MQPEGETSVTCQWQYQIRFDVKDPAKKEKYLKTFTVYVDDREVYAKEIADALEADLQTLATSGLITQISKYDTNPANNPQPPQRTRE